MEAAADCDWPQSSHPTAGPAVSTDHPYINLADYIIVILVDNDNNNGYFIET